MRIRPPSRKVLMPRTTRRIAASAALLVTALTGAAPALATPIPTTLPGPSPTVNPSGAPSQGIIMRDGGICDPIRHMGC
jgi:hypothetical protein